MILLLRHRLELAVMIGCLTLLCTTGWQVFYGAHSLQQRGVMLSKLAAIKASNAEVTAHRTQLEKRVDMMRPGNVDADLADELARSRLNMGGEGDLVVRLGQ